MYRILTISGKGLTLCYLLHEKCLLLFNVCREAFLHSILHSLFDFFLLLLALDLRFFLCYSRLSPGLSLQGLSKVGIISPLVVKIYRISCSSHQSCPELQITTRKDRRTDKSRGDGANRYRHNRRRLHDWERSRKMNDVVVLFADESRKGLNLYKTQK